MPYILISHYQILIYCRQLITIKKVSAEDHASPFDVPASDIKESGGSDASGLGAADSQHVPAHKDFREKYFRKFRKEEAGEVKESGQEEEENRTK